MNRCRVAILCLVFSVLWPHHSQAAAITNLDKNPHEIEVNNEKIAIPAGETWRIPGVAKIYYQDHEIHMAGTDEYAIWNDHEFGPQRHVNQATTLMYR